MRTVVLGVLLGMVCCVAWRDTHASGSVGPGASRIGSGGVYSVGKSLLFRELVCRRNCPIPRRGFSRDRARSLKASLEAAFTENKPGTPDDEHVKVLLDGSDAENNAKVAAVLVYIERRYRL